MTVASLYSRVRTSGDNQRRRLTSTAGVVILLPRSAQTLRQEIGNKSLVPQISPSLLLQGAAHHQDRAVFRAPYEAFGGRGRAVGAVGAACGAYHPVRGVSTGWLAGQYRGSARGWFAHRGLSLASHPVVRLVATPSTPVQSRLHASKLRKELHRLELGPDLALCTRLSQLS